MRALYIAALLLAAIGCSRYEDVRNLESGGTAIIAFGDSLTAGVGASAGGDYPTALSAMTNVTIINAGVSGDTTESALQRIDSDVLAANPRIVLIGLGGNDFLRGFPIATTEANLREITRRVQSAGAMAVILGFRFPSLRGGSYDDMYERVAEEHDALLIPDLLDGILSNPSMKSDSIHPNSAGYTVMAERVADPLRGLITAAEKATRR